MILQRNTKKRGIFMKIRKLLTKYILEVVWILVTLMIIVTASIAQMYSRSITLDNVHKKDFERVYKLLNEYDSINKKELSNILDPLISKTGYALFHVAIITESPNTCYEDTDHFFNKPLLCPIFKDTNHLINLLNISKNSTKPFEKLSTKLTKDEKKSQSYLFQKFSNSNEWFVAKTNFLHDSSELDKFKYFLTHRYIGANGYEKIYEKGKFLGAIIIIFSILFYVFFSIYRRREIHKYNTINNKLSNIQEKWEILNNRYHELISEKNLIQNKIKTKEMELKENLEIAEQDQDTLIEEINQLKTLNKDIEEKLTAKDKELRVAEHEEQVLNNEKQKKIEKLNCTIAKSEYEKVFYELSRLQQLWKYDPSWYDRKDIESNVSEKETHLPFTITQGFVAFEDKISELARTYDAYEARQKKELKNYISIVCREKDFKINRGSFDKIRLARNAWFHRAEYPSSNVISDLINFLEKYKIKPLI